LLQANTDYIPARRIQKTASEGIWGRLSHAPQLKSMNGTFSISSGIKIQSSIQVLTAENAKNAKKVNDIEEISAASTVK
jgi:hypothetical protein